MERRLIKSGDTGERNVDIIRNIRDALKVIKFHIRASTSGRVLQRRERTGLGPKGRERKGDWGRVEKDGAHLVAVRGLSLGLFFLFAVLLRFQPSISLISRSDGRHRHVACILAIS